MSSTVLVSILTFFVPYLLNFCYCPFDTFARTPSLASLLFLCLYSKFKTCLVRCSIATSLTEQDKFTWFSALEELILFSYH